MQGQLRLSAAEVKTTAAQRRISGHLLRHVPVKGFLGLSHTLGTLLSSEKLESKLDTAGSVESLPGRKIKERHHIAALDTTDWLPARPSLLPLLPTGWQ